MGNVIKSDYFVREDGFIVKKKYVTNIRDFIELFNIDTIFLDVDGVILHSVDAIVNILNRKNSTNIKPSDIMSWNFKEADPNLTNDEMEELFTLDEFFDNVKFIDGVLDFIKQYKDKIVIITKSEPKNFQGKVNLFKNNGLEDIPIIPVPINMSKRIIDMNSMGVGLLIDDSTSNLSQCNADFKIQFLEYNDNKDREWTRGWGGLILSSWY